MVCDVRGECLIFILLLSSPQTLIQSNYKPTPFKADYIGCPPLDADENREGLPRIFKSTLEYWGENVDKDDSGMVGVEDERLLILDVDESNDFLTDVVFKKYSVGRKRALDLAAGIGRVTKHVLTRHFDRIDLQELIPDLAMRATDTVHFNNLHKIGDIHVCELQRFHAQPGAYDVIWLQWGIQFLTNPETIHLLSALKLALTPTGLIIVKENIYPDQQGGNSISFEYRSHDGAFERTTSTLRKLFHFSGLDILEEYVAPSSFAFSAKGETPDDDLYPVLMWVLR